MRIDLQAVDVRVGGTRILHDVSLVIAPGSFTAIVGPNGSGKTTLLRTIYRAVRPESGAVLIGGHDVRRMPTRRAARLRAVVPQFQDADVALSALDIVATGRYSAARWWQLRDAPDGEAARAALRRVGAEHLARRDFGSLSGGERQRVLLARALAQEASTLLLDEPTNHLDARAQIDMLELVAGLPQTRLSVLHDLDHALAYADHLVVLHRGRVAASGDPVAVLTDALTRDVFGIRSRITTHPLTGRPHLLFAGTDSP